MRFAAWTIALLVALLAAPARAQTNIERFERQLEQIRLQNNFTINPDIPIEQRTYFDYGALFTPSYVSADQPAGDNIGFWEYDLTLYARLNIDGVHDFFIRELLFTRDFNPGDRFNSEGDGLDCLLERAYYRFDVARYLDTRRRAPSDVEFSIKAGQDLAYWGNGLTFSEVVAGLFVDLSFDRFAIQLVGGITPENTVDIDSSRPHFDTDTQRGFYGALFSAQFGQHRPYVYFLAQQDYNSSPGTVVLNGSDISTDYQYNSWYIGLGSNGALSDRLAYGIEMTFEGGRTLSSSVDANGAPIPQEKDSIEAFAIDLQLDYVFTDIRNTRISLEALCATGDDDRLDTTNTFGGNRAGTTDNSFNAFGLLNVGLAFGPAVSNLTMVRLGGSTFPFPDSRQLRRLQIGVDNFIYFKTDKNGPIDEPTTADSYLGWEPDIYLNWQITSDVTLAVRYGVFFPGTAIDSDDDSIRQFIYAGLTFAF